MQIYEYIVVPSGSNSAESTRILNALASDGYRLVATESSMGYTVRYLLERPVEDNTQGYGDIAG